MTTFLFRQVASAVAALLVLSGTAMAQSFHYTDPTNGGLTADFTLTTSLTTALSGTGTITSSYWSGIDDLVLVTQSTVLPAGNGQITSAGLPHVFNWIGVTNAGSTNFTADDFLGSTAPYLDSNGLAFEIVNPTTQTIVGGVHLWADSNLTSFSDVVAGAGSLLNAAAAGTSSGSLAPVPEPSTVALLAAGLGCLVLSARRRQANLA